MAWRWRSAALVGAAVLLLLAGALTLAAFPEARDEALLDLAPGHFRDAKLQRFRGPAGDELYLLGTIHGRHLSTPHYRLAHLGALIAHLKPDLVMVESRPGELARDNLGDGPIEALYADLATRETGVPVAGVDWWTMNPAHQIDSEERERRIADLVAAELPGHRRSLLLIGYAHLPAMQERLNAIGYRPAPLASAAKQALFNPTGVPATFPAGMRFYTSRRIDSDRAALAGVPDAFWRERLAAAIAARQSLLQIIYAAGERAPAARIAGAAPRR